MTEPEDTKELQWYATAFLDLLGQSVILERITELPNEDNKEERAAFFNLIKKSFGLVDMLNDSFKSHISTLAEETSVAKALSDEQRKQMRVFHSRPIKLQRFSDGLVVFSSVRELPEEPALAALNALWGLLVGCGTTYVTFLSQGYPLRGGIDLGIGLEYKEGELYGPAVHRAYKLESVVAQYPRIVIGEELINYLRSYEGSKLPAGATELEQRMFFGAKNIAAICIKLIARDVDGQMILDCLGDLFREQFIEVGLGQAIHSAFDFVQAQLKEARSKKDFKLASRYLMLLQYITTRMPKWPKREAS